MKTVRPLALLCTLLGAFPAASAQVRWEAGHAAGAAPLLVPASPGSVTGTEFSGGAAVLRLEPSTGYCQAAYRSMLPAAIPNPFWLTLEYLDRGCGLISVPVALPQSAQSGVASVNSGALRRAVFRIDRRPQDGFLDVTGPDSLVRVKMGGDDPGPAPARWWLRTLASRGARSVSPAWLGIPRDRATLRKPWPACGTGCLRSARPAVDRGRRLLPRYLGQTR